MVIQRVGRENIMRTLPNLFATVGMHPFLGAPAAPGL
jgi:hypothetical protein